MRWNYHIDKKLNKVVPLVFMKKVNISDIFLKDCNIPDSEVVTSSHQSLGVHPESTSQILALLKWKLIFLYEKIGLDSRKTDND